MSKDSGASARSLLKEQSVGTLSTIIKDPEGYPFGSITPYALNRDGEPIILISDIAQHTRNIKNDPRASLTVFDAASADPQASGRLTWVGDAEIVSGDDKESKRRYLSYFPSSASFFQMHDFALYRIRLKRARFIGGFGEIYWVANEAMLLANPLAEIDAGIVEHMNEDHSDALLKYCRVLKGAAPSRAIMAGIDSEGFDVLADGRKVRFRFDEPVTTAEEARAALVKLARMVS